MEKTVVILSGGMDSSLCLAIAISQFGADNTYALTFSYSQRHSNEILAAKKICHDWKIHHQIIPVPALPAITHNALIDSKIAIEHAEDCAPNTLVVGRNGLMARLGAIYAQHIHANSIFMGIIETEAANSGYRDCSRFYMDLKQSILCIDLDNPNFKIHTPLVFLDKLQTLQLAQQLHVLDYLLEHTVSCYEGINGWGCRLCPSCLLRNEGIKKFITLNPHYRLPAIFS